MFIANRLPSSKGFSLIEIMVVIAIIGILVATVAPKIIGRTTQARELKAREDVMALSSSMDLYNLDNGFYPSQQQGLEALVRKPHGDPVPHHWKEGGYIKLLPDDPWGNPYHYVYPGTHTTFDIFSYGANGKPHGKGENATIGNWQK
jgi:general secretion pathway protein G